MTRLEEVTAMALITLHLGQNSLVNFTSPNQGPMLNTSRKNKIISIYIVDLRSQFVTSSHVSLRQAQQYF
jgi:hypothetical protein